MTIVCLILCVFFPRFHPFLRRRLSFLFANWNAEADNPQSVISFSTPYNFVVGMGVTEVSKRERENASAKVQSVVLLNGSRFNSQAK